MAEEILVSQQRVVDPDLPLIQDIAEGRAAALDELYQRHGLPLLRYLISRLDDRQQAEEVLQNVMLAVWQGAAGRFRGDSTVWTWLCGIANKQIGKKTRRRILPTQPLSDSLIAGDADFSEQFGQRDEMQAALAELPPIQQQAIELVFYHGLSGAESAERLGIPLNTLKSHLFRAKRNLRTHLDREF